jgi:hypothetical protein
VAAVVLAPFPAIRHVLLVLPPVLLFILGDGFTGHKRRAGKVAIVLTAVLGIGVAIADVRQADVYRREAPRFAQLPGRVWYVGHWGWGVYAARNGMKEYEPGTSALVPGDTMVIPQNVHEQRLSERDRERLVLSSIDVVPADRLSLLRTVTRAGGFYYYWGAVPWTFRTGPLERFSIYSVR